MIVIQTIIILGVLIFVHELGHFGAAKMSGVRVNEFALGMGPALIKKKHGETQYSLRVLPIGGFCAMEGEDGDSDDLKSFEKKPASVKAVILAAGSFMNVMLAILIMSGMVFIGSVATTELRSVAEGSPAYAAGIVQGDTIISIDGVEVHEWQDIVALISGTQRNSLAIGIVRDGREFTVQTGVTTTDDGRIVIGITPETATRLTNPVTALTAGTRASYDMLVNMVEIIGMLFRGGVPVSDLIGPVGIAFVVEDTASRGMRPLLFLVSLISLNLAIVNLLPFPALDGGRLLLLGIRKITGRAISDKMEGTIHIIGMVLLLLLMLYITWNDIDRFILGTFNFG